MSKIGASSPEGCGLISKSLWLSLAAGIFAMYGLAVATCGCQSLHRERRPLTAAEVQAMQQVQRRLSEFVNSYQSDFDQTVSQLDAGAATPRERRAAARWRVRMADQCQKAIAADSPIKTLADLWTVYRQVNDYLSAGDGQALFGANQKRARGLAQMLLTDFEHIPRELLPAAEFASLQSAIQAHCARNPVTGEFDFPVSGIPEDSEIVSAFRRVLSVPMSPFNALSGIGKAPETVRDVATSVDRFRETVEDFPGDVRWQLKLLATELSDTPTTTGALASLKEFAASSDRFSHSFEALPRQLRLESQELLRQANDAQPEWRETLAAGQTTAAEIKGAADSLERAAAAVTVTAGEIQKLIPVDSKDASGRLSHSAAPAAAPGDEGFSFQAVTASAEALTLAAQEIQRLLVDVRGLLADAASPAGGIAVLDGRVKKQAEDVGEHIGSLVDRITLRLAQVLLLFFLLLSLHRRLSPRGSRTTTDRDTPLPRAAPAQRAAESQRE